MYTSQERIQFGEAVGITLMRTDNKTIEEIRKEILEVIKAALLHKTYSYTETIGIVDYYITSLINNINRNGDKLIK